MPSVADHPPSEPRSLEKRYDLRFERNQAYRQGVWRVLCAHFFAQYVGPDAVVLDIGAGWGEFINNIRAGRKYAMDLNPATRSRVHKDVTCLQQDCSQPWPLPADVLDIVFTSNFLEHLADKASVERTLEQAFRCLKPGGVLICLGPNIRCLGGAYWDFWDHYVALTDRSLAEGLAFAGFRVERQVARFLPFSMSTGLRPPLWTVWWYLKLPPVWSLAGKQFLLVARKPATG